jgi:hypothetical protein
MLNKEKKVVEAVAQTEQASVRKLTAYEDMDTSLMVNEVKSHRAFKAVFGGAKSGSAELVIASKLRAEGFSGDELFVETYKALGGLMNKEKATVNRENEKKQKAKKK